MPTKEELDYLFSLVAYRPTDEQLAIHTSSARIRIVAGGERGGKLLYTHTPIPTPSGWRVVDDIQPGDFVFGDDGTPTQVSWVSEVQTEELCFEIAFDTGEVIIAGQSHQWATQSEKERKNTRRRKKDGTEYCVSPSPLISERKHSIRTTMQLAEKTLLLRPKTKWGTGVLSNYSIPSNLPVHYLHKELPIHPYLLGTWLGDGTSKIGQVTSALDDYEIPTRVERLGYIVYACPSKPESWMVQGLTKQLRLLGVQGNKHIPEQYLQSSIEQRLDLLRGLMDTDGSATSKGCEFYNNNKQLIQDVRELLFSLGIKNWVRSKEAKLYGKSCGIAYTITFSPSVSVFYLTRKGNKQVKAPTGHTRENYIRSVTSCPPVPVKCLSVNNESHLFLVGHSFIPTHNSLSAEKDLFARHFEGKLFWLVAADYGRTAAEFNYLCADLEAAHIKFEATKQVDPGEIRTELGIRFATKSAKDPRKLAMEAPDGIVVCEASQIDYETFLRLSGRLAEKRGWMLLSGTFEQSIGWYVDLYQRGLMPNAEGIVSFSLPTWTNRVVFPGGREDPEIKRLEATMTPEWFMERFGGVPCPPKGLVFNEFRSPIHTGIGREFEFDPSKECYLWIDPGYAEAYAVLAVQRRGQELVVFDEIYERGLITSDIIKVAKQRPWWNKVIGGTIDIAGTQHQAMAAPAEIWIKEAGVSLHSQKVRIQDGIEAYKRFLLVSPLTNKPMVRINAACKGLISEHGGCPNPLDGQTKVYKWRADHEGNTIGDVPEDKHNHAIKAMCYGVVDMYGFSTGGRTVTKVQYI